jgi:antirestriction protein
MSSIINKFFSISKSFQEYLGRRIQVASETVTSPQTETISEHNNDIFIIMEIIEKLKDVDDLFELLKKNVETKNTYVVDTKHQRDLIIRFYMIKMIYQNSRI